MHFFIFPVFFMIMIMNMNYEAIKDNKWTFWKSFEKFQPLWNYYPNKHQRRRVLEVTNKPQRRGLGEATFFLSDH